MTKERWSNSAEKGKLKKGPWTFEEDLRLLRSIRIYGEGRWSALAKAAGLQRCGKSCRLRWVNYLRPDLKRGNITPEEERMIIELHSVWGNRWSLIAEKMPGRTDNEIKNYWRCHLKKKLQAVAAGANKEATGPPMQSNPESSFRNVQQAGSTHTNTNSNQVQNQNQNPFLDCLQSPLSLPSENNSNNQSHKLAEYGGPSSTSNDLVDIKPDVQAEGSGVPLPGILCRLGSEIPLIEDDLTALQGMGAEHRGEMYPTQHQALQECCNFDSAIEMDMTSDSILWGMCPLLAQPQPQPQNSFCDHAQLTYDVPPQNVDPKHVSLL